MIQSGNGGYLTITQDGSVAVDQFEAPEWAAAAYKVDDIVRTEDSTDGTKEVKYWRSKATRTSVAGDGIAPKGKAATANTAALLDPTYWEVLPVGQPYTLLNWALDAPTTTSERELLAEASPRVEYTTGAITLQCQFADNWEGDKTQQALENRNSLVYVEFYPKGKGTGLEVYKGNARVGAYSKAGRPGEDITFDVSLAFDGDPTIEAQT